MQGAAFANLGATRRLVKRRLAADPQTNALIRTTAAPTMLEGSVKDNVLPARARAVVNFRLLPGDTVQGLLAHVRRVVADPRVEVRPFGPLTAEPSPISPTDGEAFAALHRTIAEIFPAAVVAPYLVVGATDARHFTGLTPNVYRFTPMWVSPADMARIHGTDERVAVGAYADAIRFYHQLIRNTADGNGR
jgi:carboxypeptidase PM20D1